MNFTPFVTANTHIFSKSTLFMTVFSPFWLITYGGRGVNPISPFSLIFFICRRAILSGSFYRSKWLRKNIRKSTLTTFFVFFKPFTEIFKKFGEKMKKKLEFKVLFSKSWSKPCILPVFYPKFSSADLQMSIKSERRVRRQIKTFWNQERQLCNICKNEENTRDEILHLLDI